MSFPLFPPLFCAASLAACWNLPAQQQPAHASAPPSCWLPKGATPPLFSFVCFSFQVRSVGNHHFYISDQSSGLRIGVELHGITGDVEICALNLCPFLRA